MIESSGGEGRIELQACCLLAALVNAGGSCLSASDPPGLQALRTVVSLNGR